MYEISDIGFLADDCETTFTDQHLFDKNMVLCLDCSEEMRLKKTRFNSWVTGEPLTVNRKFKTAMTVNWKPPVGFASNCMPGIKSVSGSGTRRFVIFKFDHVVVNTDTGLYDACMKELPAFLIKCCRMYFKLVEAHGGQSLWDSKDILPPMCHRAREEYARQNDPIVAFISSDYITMDPNSRASVADMSLAYNDYISTRGRSDKVQIHRDFNLPLLKQALTNYLELSIDDSGDTPVVIGVRLDSQFASEPVGINI